MSWKIAQKLDFSTKHRNFEPSFGHRKFSKFLESTYEKKNLGDCSQTVFRHVKYEVPLWGTFKRYRKNTKFFNPKVNEKHYQVFFGKQAPKTTRENYSSFYIMQCFLEACSSKGGFQSSSLEAFALMKSRKNGSFFLNFEQRFLPSSPEKLEIFLKIIKRSVSCCSV